MNHGRKGGKPEAQADGTERWCQGINELLQEVGAPRPFSRDDVKLVVSVTICHRGNDNIRLLRRRRANGRFTGNFFTSGVNK